jgi:hypothetical protein
VKIDQDSATVAACDRWTGQRADALALANHIRSRRSQLKRRLTAGEESIATVIADPPAYLRTARIDAWIMAAPGIGTAKAGHLLREARIAPRTPIGRLSDRQRTQLAAKLARFAPRNATG